MTLFDRPLCKCHGEPMHRNRDPRYRAGFFWRCGVLKNQKARNRYDNDPIYRISKRLRDDARARRKRLEAAKARYVAEFCQPLAGTESSDSSKNMTGLEVI